MLVAIPRALCTALAGEVAKALRRGGAKRIYAAFVARSSPPGQPQPIAGSKSR